jgi:hypothetical protein
MLLSDRLVSDANESLENLRFSGCGESSIRNTSAVPARGAKRAGPSAGVCVSDANAGSSRAERGDGGDQAGAFEGEETEADVEKLASYSRRLGETATAQHGNSITTEVQQHHNRSATAPQQECNSTTTGVQRHHNSIARASNLPSLLRYLRTAFAEQRDALGLARLAPLRSAVFSSTVGGTLRRACTRFARADLAQ